MRFAIVVFDGFDEIDALGPYEVFKNAESFGADLMVDLVTLSGQDQVTAAHGLRLHTNGVLDDSYDVVLVPGGGYNDRADTGTWAEITRGDLPVVLAKIQPNTVLASVCSGAMLLSAAGLLHGRPVTTHAGAQADLAAQGGQIVDARVVDDGNILTSAGVTAAFDMALHLVERYAGADLAGQVSNEMEYARVGSVQVSR